MRKWGFKPVVLLLLAPFVLLSVFVLVERVRGRITLGRYKRALLAQGVKLSPRDFVSSPMAAENGALEVNLTAPSRCTRSERMARMMAETLACRLARPVLQIFGPEKMWSGLRPPR